MRDAGPSPRKGLVETPAALTEQVPDPARPLADENLVELGPRSVEEGHVRLASHGSCQQSLARAGGSHQEHTWGRGQTALSSPLSVVELKDTPSSPLRLHRSRGFSSN